MKPHQPLPAPYGAGPTHHRVRLMGIVNVTPDSFSDGGWFLAPDRAIAQAREVSAEEELARVAPVLEGIRGVDAAISIDTSKAAVAVASLDAGAEIVNDVTALRHD